MLTEKDLKQIAERGISEKQVEAQLKQIAEGFPFLKLEAAASTEKGILAPSNDEKAQDIKAWDNYKAEGHKVVKFVPASGAASRMFKNMFANFNCEIVVLNDVDDAKTIEKEIFNEIISLIHCFAMKVYSSRRQKKLKCVEEDLKIEDDEI